MTELCTIGFRKMNGLGNEFVILDGRRDAMALTTAQTRAIADRETGIGCDQLIVMEPSKRADVRMRIWNRDGGEVESCGNASRCVADLLFDETGRDTVTIDTKGGFLICTRAPDGRVTVDMGVPRFDWQQIPLSEPFHDTRAIELQVGPIDKPLLHSPSVVNVGNPHCIFWVDDVEAHDLGRFGPMLEFHPLFPERANISLCEVREPDHLVLRVWERGAGLTRARWRFRSCGWRRAHPRLRHRGLCRGGRGREEAPHRPGRPGHAARRRSRHSVARVRRPHPDDRTGQLRVQR